MITKEYRNVEEVRSATKKMQEWHASVSELKARLLDAVSLKELLRGWNPAETRLSHGAGCFVAKRLCEKHGLYVGGCEKHAEKHEAEHGHAGSRSAQAWLQKLLPMNYEELERWAEERALQLNVIRRMLGKQDTA